VNLAIPFEFVVAAVGLVVDVSNSVIEMKDLCCLFSEPIKSTSLNVPTLVDVDQLLFPQSLPVDQKRLGPLSGNSVS
jgi:hypothetical protein